MVRTEEVSPGFLCAHDSIAATAQAYVPRLPHVQRIRLTSSDRQFFLPVVFEIPALHGKHN